jgi:hypothetical protein
MGKKQAILLEFIITYSSVTVKTGKILSSIPANIILTSYDIRHAEQL